MASSGRWTSVDSGRSGKAGTEQHQQQIARRPGDEAGDYYVRADGNGAIVAPVRPPPGRQRVRRLAVRILEIDRGAAPLFRRRPRARDQ